MSWADEVRRDALLTSVNGRSLPKAEEVKRDTLLTSANGRGLPKAEE
jgi:hypothetical protein